MMEDNENEPPSCAQGINNNSTHSDDQDSLEALEAEDKVNEMTSSGCPRFNYNNVSGRAPAPPRRMNTLSVINIAVVNEDGEKDDVEIDIADEEAKEDEKYIPNARRQSISDRISKRRTSELAAEIIRLSAENRKREFAELLEDHHRLVSSINNGSKAGSPSTLDSIKDVDENNIVEDDDIDYDYEETKRRYSALKNDF